MKTEFSILWVDDNRGFAEAVALELENWLDKKGFDLKVSIHPDKTGVLDEINKREEIELLIVDYKLPKGNGDELIQEIRQNRCYQDIVFYTGESLEPLLQKRFDGVFYVSKGDAANRIKELIELRLKRSSDLATLRGWIVADAIELELMLDDLLMQCFDPKHELFEAQILRRSFILDFYKKQVIINSILSEELKRLSGSKDKSERTKKLQECKAIFKSFDKDVVHYRNAVAHSKVETTPDGTKRLKSLVPNPEYYEFDESGLIEGRNNLRKQRDCLITLRKFI